MVHGARTFLHRDDFSGPRPSSTFSARTRMSSSKETRGSHDDSFAGVATREQVDAARVHVLTKLLACSPGEIRSDAPRKRSISFVVRWSALTIPSRVPHAVHPTRDDEPSSACGHW